MILSGFFSGFAESVGERHILTSDDVARALQIGTLRARERVEHPQEGTILSVGEAAARHASECARVSRNVFEVIHAAWEGAKRALSQTSRQLQILHENHVVDAGGQGLVYFLEGLVRYSQRQPLDESTALAASPAPQPPVGVAPPSKPFTVFKFCTELILAHSRATVSDIRAVLQPLGEELMVAAQGSLIKIHIHAKDAESIFRQLEPLGTITWRKVDDMEQQHRETFFPAHPR